jgi:hypothetical protein
MDQIHRLLLSLLPLFSAAAIAQLPAPALLSRTAPRATWTAVASAGTTTSGTLSGGSYPATVNTTFRVCNQGAASHDKLWVFGGSLANNTATTTNDLWVFDAVAGTFTQRIAHGAAGSPPSRGRAAVAWNPLTSRLIVFGGNTRGTTPTLLDDTWEYDPTTNSWTNVTPTVSPSPRQDASMAFDPTLGGMLLFGGRTNDIAPPTYSNETWLFLGSAWVPLSPATSPPARAEHSLVTRNDAFQDVLLCSGLDNSSAAPDQIRFLDVWTWNGTTWTKISDYDVVTSTGTSFPAACVGNQAVYDPIRRRVVLQGGNGHSNVANSVYVYGPSYGGSPSNYTSEFDCMSNTWSILANPTTGSTPFNNTDPVIGRVSRYATAFVAATGKVYKACGQDPTKTGSRPTYNVYAYQASPLADAVAYGAGCAGAGGTLALTSSDRPWTGRTWTGTCSTLGPASLSLAIWGLGTQALPLHLVLPIAPPGCILLNTAEGLDGPGLPAGGTAAISLVVPNSISLAGAVLHVQVAELEFDLSFAWTGLYTSNGLTLTVGAL